MGTARQSVQHADAESGMSVVSVRLGLLVGGAWRVRMDVHVALAIMLVLVCVNAEGLA